MTMNDETFLWYDFETFGADPRRDRPAQFAALRTDGELEIVGDPEMFYCRPAEDMLPQPMACLITGITPQQAREKGMPENEFAARIERLMSVPDTCVVGYNSFRFDDEVTRHLFWRNFIDPYRREYANGNSRFDLIDLLRLARAVRPEGIAWADHEDGRPSFRLEDLAAANGLDVSSAHDALADVRATIGMARLLREAQPRLWQWALSLRDRQQADRLLAQQQPLLHASSRFPALPGCGVAPVLPLARHPQIASQWLVWNLNVDPEAFQSLSSEALADRYWTASADLPEGVERVPVKLVRNNRCPMLAPLNVLDSARASALGIDLEALEGHARILREQPDLVDRLGSLFARPAEAAPADPEIDLYGGFPPNRDRPVIERVRNLEGPALAGLDAPFSDERLNELLFRYRARLFPETLDAEEQERWARYRQRRLVDDPDLASIRLAEYRQQIATLMQERPEQAEILRELAEWPTQIGLIDDAGAAPGAGTNNQ